jgi:hypothetical protein
MPALRDLLELLYNAHHRFQTIHIAWHYRYDVAAMLTVQERYAEREPGFSPLTSRSTVVESPLISETRHQLWWRKPDAWRLEWTMQERMTIQTRFRNDFWTRSSTEGQVVHHNNETVRHTFSDVEDLVQYVQLLSPAFLLASHDLQIEGKSIHAGRQVIQVRAIYEKYKSFLHEDFFWASADEYRLLVDAETGILIRYAAIFEEKEFAVTSVDSATFDQPIPDAMFEAPTGS